MPNKEIKAIANGKTVDSVKMKMSDAEWLKRCEERYTFKGLAALYGKAIDEVEELQQKLIKANNELIGKDAKIASMQNACDPLIVEDACTFVLSLFRFWKANKTTIFKIDDETIENLQRIGEALNDYQNYKPNPFSDEYFRNLTYAQIAELAKKSIRLTTEHCEDSHKIEELQQKCEKLDEENQSLYNKNLELVGEIAVIKRGQK